MTETEKKLSEMFELYFGEDLSFLPALDIQIDSIFVCDDPYKDDVFPIMGCIKDIRPNIKNNSGAVSRSFLGYTASLRMIQNKILFNYIMGAQLNSIIKGATNTLGPLTLRKIKMFKYDNGSYFREIECSAGIEFKVIVEKEIEET